MVKVSKFYDKAGTEGYLPLVFLRREDRRSGLNRSGKSSLLRIIAGTDKDLPTVKSFFRKVIRSGISNRNRSSTKRKQCANS